MYCITEQGGDGGTESSCSQKGRVTRIQTRISHVHPTASIHQRGTLLRLCYCGVLRAGALPAMLWRTRVPVTRTLGVRPPWSDGWELLGLLGVRGGAGRRRTGPKPAAGREQEDRGRIRADDVYPECWRSIH